MKYNKIDKEKKDEILSKLTYNLIEINQLTKLDMANSLLEETLKNIKNNRKDGDILNSNINSIKEKSKSIEELFRNEMGTLSNKIDAILVTKINFITKITVEYINKVQEQTNLAQRKLSRLQKRKKILDYLIMFNLFSTPFLLILIIYLEIS